jgi:DNA polymerase-4
MDAEKPNDCHILHSDMNSFYASVEQAEHPELRGLPVVVGGDEKLRHGIVLTKSKEAKAYGIKTAETLWQARQKCPHVVIVPPNFGLYIRYSQLAREIYYQYTDLVEPFGLDECWMDVSGSKHLFGDALMIAREISERVKSELGLTVSIGVSWNKIFAKFGSDYKKPDAITVVDRSNYRSLVWDSPVRELLYVGAATERKLQLIGIKTIGELALAEPEMIRKYLGKAGAAVQTFARGEDATPVKPYDPGSHDVDRVIKSFGNGLTAPHDIADAQSAKALIYLLAESVAQRMREAQFRARTVSVAVRYASDLSGCVRQTKLPRATNATSPIAGAAFKLLAQNEPLDETRPLRSLHVCATDLVAMGTVEQLMLFDESNTESQEQLDAAIDDLRRRFGNGCVIRGVELSDQSLKGLDIKQENVVHPVSFFHT